MVIERHLRALAFHALFFKDNARTLLPDRADFRRWAALDAGVARARSLERLKALLIHAQSTSPYYGKLFEAHGFDPLRMRSASELETLPTLSRELLAAHKETMRSSRFPREQLAISHTGGSSGTPAAFYQDRRCTAQRFGRQWGILERCGYPIGTRCALVWGVHTDLPDPNLARSLKARLRKYASGRETLCCTVMTAEGMLEFHQRLLHFKPAVLYGYPNAIQEFAEFVSARGLAPLRVRRVLCTAERLTEGQRELFERSFGAEVYNLYCTREHGCIGFECREHKGMHIDIGSVHVEILANGKPAEAGVPGEIVVTDLLNYGMPMVRSRIGDTGSLASEPCRCGCGLPLLQAFEGRVTDTLQRPDGSRVAGLMLVDMFMDDPVIDKIQIVQVRPSEITLNMVVTDGFGPADRERAVAETRKFMGEAVQVKVNLVADIPRNPRSGKYQEVICRIRPPEQ